MVDGRFRVLNWNIGGAKYLELKSKDSPNYRRSKQSREDFHGLLNRELGRLVNVHEPHVIALQEVVEYEKHGNKEEAECVVVPPRGYHYWPYWLIDTKRHGNQGKWNKVRREGEWPEQAYFAQGNALLVSEKVGHFSIWDLPSVKQDHGSWPCSGTTESLGGPDRQCMEAVALESGLYFGDRNTEPRAALVAHLVVDKLVGDGSARQIKDPLDVFVVNLHLTTLMMEREGVPSIDEEAAQTRLRQLGLVLDGIVSSYNQWRREGYPIRGRHVEPQNGRESHDRHSPIWVIAGDFNFTPESMEYQTLVRRGFIDMMPWDVDTFNVPCSIRTKSQGIGEGATITVDYVFAGPRYEAIDPEHATLNRRNSSVDQTVEVSDHKPLIAHIPIRVEDPIPAHRRRRPRDLGKPAAAPKRPAGDAGSREATVR